MPPLPSRADGDHGGGDADDDAPSATPTAPPPQGLPQNVDPPTTDSSADSEDTGFVEYQSTAAKKRAKKAARDGNASEPPLPAPRPKRAAKQGTSLTQRSDLMVRERTATTRRKPTPIERKFYHLLECLRANAHATTVVEAFAQFQREVRSKEEEAKMQFTKIYVAELEEDRDALHDLLRRWLFAPAEPASNQLPGRADRQRPIWIQDLIKRMKQFKLHVSQESERPHKNAWINDLMIGSSTHATPDGDTLMPVAPSKPVARRDRVAALPVEAAQQLTAALAATGEHATLPATATEHLSLLSHAYVTTAIAGVTHGQLVAQLSGGTRIDAAATYADLLALIDGNTPTLADAARRFKHGLVGAFHDPAANRIVFTLATKALAEEWNGEQLPFQHRIVALQRPRATGSPDDGTTLDPETYEMVVCNLGGTLTYLNIWHLFHGLLRLQLVDISQAPADAQGLIDPTRWVIVVKSRGCPKSLVGKTRVVWRNENVWIHHTAFAQQPPCTRCDHAGHTARKCPNANVKHPSAVITVTGPLLDISDAAKQLAQRTPTQLQAALQEQEARLREQSMMGGEDVPAPPHEGPIRPMGPPLVVPAANRIARPRLWRRICEFARTQIVRKLLRLRELAAASEAWRLEAHSYRLQPSAGSMRPPEEDNDHLAATIRLYKVTAVRPVPELAKPAILDVETDSREKLNWPVDPELRHALERTGETIQQQVAATIAKERRRIRIERRKQARARAAALAAEHAANARLPFTSPLQHAAEEARLAALQALVPFDSALQRAALAAQAADAVNPEQHTDASQPGPGDCASEDDYANENLPENMDLTGAPTGVLAAPPLSESKSGPFGMDKGAKKPAHLDYPASLLPVMRGRERVKLESARPYEAKHKRGSKPVVITRAVDPQTGEIQREKAAKIRRNGKRDNGQSTITRHFAAAKSESGTKTETATRAEATPLDAKLAPAGADPSAEDVVLLKVVPAAAALDNEEAWRLLLDELQLMEVITPPDGHCFFSACHCIKTGVCPKKPTAKQHIATTRKEANHYRQGCYATLLDHYATHVATGLLQEDDLRHRLKGPVADADLRERIQDYLAAAKALKAGTTAPPTYWASELEIKSTVTWFREPMLVFDKGETGVIFAWLYHLALTAPLDDTPPQETVTMTHLSVDEATVWLKRFEAARVVPLVIVLRRTDGTTYGNHFNGLRIRAHLYAEWAGSSKKRARMALRRRQLLEDAGMYVPPAWNPLVSPPTALRATQDSDSSYIPTPSDSSARTPGGDPADEQPTGSYSRGLSLFEVPSLTGSGSPIVGSTPTGTPLFAASLVTPQSPLTDSDYMMLLGSSKLPNSLVPQHLERWLRKALRDNQAAYEQWKRIARGQGPAAEALHTARTIEDACTALLSWPETLMDMLHAVPYVPVVFARIPGFLHQLGYELLILGRTAHLREIINDSSTPAAAVQLASPWLAAIEATVSRSDCWRLANSATRWGRLKKKMKNASALPRSLARVSDTEWGELLAHMMVHHSSLPPTLRVQPVATRCKHLLCWTATPANADTARAGVAAFTNGGWTFPSELFRALAVAYTPLSAPSPSPTPAEAAGASRN